LLLRGISALFSGVRGSSGYDKCTNTDTRLSLNRLELAIGNRRINNCSEKLEKSDENKRSSEVRDPSLYLYLLIELAALSFGLFGAYLVGNGRMFWGYLVIGLAAFIFATDLGTFAFGSPTNVWGLASLWCNAAGA